jgi:hypothetical protein
MCELLYLEKYVLIYYNYHRRVHIRLGEGIRIGEQVINGKQYYKSRNKPHESNEKA